MYLGVATTLKAFTPTSSSSSSETHMLSFERGDRVAVMRVLSPAWAIGRMDSDVGLFPLGAIHHGDENNHEIHDAISSCVPPEMATPLVVPIAISTPGSSGPSSTLRIAVAGYQTGVEVMSMLARKLSISLTYLLDCAALFTPGTDMAANILAPIASILPESMVSSQVTMRDVALELRFAVRPFHILSRLSTLHASGANDYPLDDARSLAKALQPKNALPAEYLLATAAFSDSAASQLVMTSPGLTVADLVTTLVTAGYFGHAGAALPLSCTAFFLPFHQSLPSLSSREPLPLPLELDALDPSVISLLYKATNQDLVVECALSQESCTFSLDFHRTLLSLLPLFARRFGIPFPVGMQWSEWARAGSVTLHPDATSSLPLNATVFECQIPLGGRVYFSLNLDACKPPLLPSIWDSVPDTDINNGDDIEAASLDTLVQYLTSEAKHDLQFQKIFLLTYESFTDPDTLFTKLEQRYHVPRHILQSTPPQSNNPSTPTTPTTTPSSSSSANNNNVVTIAGIAERVRAAFGANSFSKSELVDLILGLNSDLISDADQAEALGQALASGGLFNGHNWMDADGSTVFQLTPDKQDWETSDTGTPATENDAAANSDDGAATAAAAAAAAAENDVSPGNDASADGGHHGLDQFNNGIQSQIQLRVVNVLRNWLSSQPFHALSPGLQIRMFDFVTSTLVDDGKGSLAASLYAKMRKQFCAKESRFDRSPLSTVAAAAAAVAAGSGASSSLSPEKEKPTRRRRKASLLLDGSVWNVDARDIAEQLALIDYDLFAGILPAEFLNQNYAKPARHPFAPHLMKFIGRFNAFSGWVASLVVRGANAKARATRFGKMLEVATACKELNNFASLMAIVSGLNHVAVSRLRLTKAALSKSQARTLEELERLVSAEGSYKEMRAKLAQVNPPCVPFIGIFIKDLTFIEENADKIDGAINFGKRRLMYETIARIMLFQSAPYTCKFNHVLASILTDLPDLLDDDALYSQSLVAEPRSGARATAAASSSSPVSTATTTTTAAKTTTPAQPSAAASGTTDHRSEGSASGAGSGAGSGVGSGEDAAGEDAAAPDTTVTTSDG